MGEQQRWSWGFGVALGIALTGCQPHPEGEYEFDLAESKQCLLDASKEHPEENPLLDKLLEFEQNLRATLRIEPDGTFVDTSSGLLDGKPYTQVDKGTWVARHSRLTFKVPDKDDMICDIEGKRLRCFKPSTIKLAERYVMIRKAG
ncbi:MAG TPA: hypothetical protein VNG33_03530 [Polyangiaceae bacterium]|nr:hypothetical protein [Polyangiaceae bacterium]